MSYETQFPKYGKEFHYQGVQQILEHLIPRPDPGISAKPDSIGGIWIKVTPSDGTEIESILIGYAFGLDGEDGRETYTTPEGIDLSVPFLLELPEDLTGAKIAIGGVAVNSEEVEIESVTVNGVEAEQDVESVDSFENSFLITENYDPATKIQVEITVDTSEEAPENPTT
jgi:hypothetical protein